MAKSLCLASLVSQPVGRCSKANSTGSNDALRRRSGFCAHSGFAVSGASNEFVIVVPAGFLTDFAGTPRALSDRTLATVVHDFLYWDQG